MHGAPDGKLDLELLPDALAGTLNHMVSQLDVLTQVGALACCGARALSPLG
jgi:hypothetical protein